MDQKTIEARARDYIAKEGDAGFRAEVESLLKAGDWKELEDRFYRDLEFGTGGLRGVIGGGYNRMNNLVVSRATQGLCDYLRKAFPGKALSACIAYDSPRSRPGSSRPTASRLTFSGASGRRPSSPSPSERSRPTRASSSRRATTRPSTTATRLTGTTAPRSRLPTTRASSPW